jgi:hypothetical protein
MSFFPHARRTTEPAYTNALAETRAVLSATCERLVNCNSGRLPGRAIGSLCDLQRATDHLENASRPHDGRAHVQLVRALHDLQEDVAELARRGGPPDTILRSASLARAQQALSRLGPRR